MRIHLRELLTRAIEKTAQGGALNSTELPPVLLEPPKQREFGDLATNVAMLWAKTAKKPPRAIAETILKNLEDPDGILARKEIAGPGFLNFAFAPKFYYQRLRELAAGKEAALDLGHGAKVQVEFASVNPTGPLHVGHGRVAVIGDVLARLHEATGFKVEREYYVNDAGKQMENLGLSLYARYRELFGEKVDFPEDGYPGEYVTEIAAEIKQKDGDKYLKETKDVAVDYFRRYGGHSLLETIRRQLGEFGIEFGRFFYETDLTRAPLRGRSEVAITIDHLRERGLLYTEEGAQWFRSTQFGDDKDRAVIKSDGELTYFASDIAYHRNKFERRFAKLINVWGADHHGYVPRLKAALRGLGYDPEVLQVVLVQMVQLTRGGEPVRMGKRTGEFVSLDEVLEEVGRDAARFFLLMRKSDSHLDFDLDLAKRQSSENPVFYVQYAHARVASIFEQALKNGVAWNSAQRKIVPVERLELTEELELIRKMSQINDVLEESVRELEPHRIVFYLLDLAGEFHRYYNRCRVISEDEDLTRARLLLVENTQKTIRRGLEILGVAAPLKMAAR
ncbi:MAG: arginine--tRNA ligase [Deltaproteobacteria bacterium]|nr:arginine--tRNA ligase [Deltaproteobacteria bacterium]MBI2227884.1 arginine--tRNA ligase [Deltaproteobacteria bacterium]MBI3063521.1 arginine--tRNA ligase [Deltaproteobacteria bacterium]